MENYPILTAENVEPSEALATPGMVGLVAEHASELYYEAKRGENFRSAKAVEFDNVKNTAIFRYPNGALYRSSFDRNTGKGVFRYGMHVPENGGYRTEMTVVSYDAESAVTFSVTERPGAPAEVTSFPTAMTVGEFERANENLVAVLGDNTKYLGYEAHPALKKGVFRRVLQRLVTPVGERNTTGL